MSVEEAAARISDFSQPFDVSLFEMIVDAAYQPSNPQQQTASRVLVQLQEHPGIKYKTSVFFSFFLSRESKFIVTMYIFSLRYFLFIDVISDR